MLRKVLLIAHNHKQSLCSGQGNVKSVRGLCESQRILFGEAVLSESRKIGRIVFVGLNNMASHHRDNDYIALHTLESVNGTNSDGNILVEFCQSPYLLYLFPVETDDSNLLVFLFVKFVKVPGERRRRRESVKQFPYYLNLTIINSRSSIEHLGAIRIDEQYVRIMADKRPHVNAMIARCRIAEIGFIDSQILRFD